MGSLDRLEDRIKALEDRIDRLWKEISNIKEDIGYLQGTLWRLSKIMNK